MITDVSPDLEEKVLKRFIVGRDMPGLSNREEERIFQDLQRYDLIRVTSFGKIKITERGEYALGVGVKSFITTERFEKRLIKDSLKAKTHSRWLSYLFLFVLVILVLVAFLANYSEEILFG